MSASMQETKLADKLRIVEATYLAVIPSAPDTSFLEDEQILDYISSPAGQKWLVEHLLERVGPDAANAWRLRYWKRIIAVLETRLGASENVEVDSRLYDNLCLFLSSATTTWVLMRSF